MLGILKNKNIRMIETDVNDNEIKIEIKLKKPIVDMNRFELYSAIYDFDDFIKSMFFDNNLCNYMNTDDYNYQLLTKGDKSSEQILFLLLYKYILSFKNDMIDYSYYG